MHLENKIGSNYKVFLAYFLSLMLLTYIWRLVFVAAAFYPELNVDFLNYFTDGALALTYVGLAYIVYLRGKAINKPYLFYMPCIAALFDLIIVAVLMVPTVVNITTLFFAYLGSGLPKDEP